MKKIAAWILAVCLVFGLTACSQKENHVYVQNVSALSQMGGIATTDRFSGIVVSESVSEIKKDDDKVVEEVYVKLGDDVKKDQPLFTYDTEQLQLNLEKQQLEVAQLQSSIENYGAQIVQLEKDRDRAWAASDKLKFNLQIQTNQIDLKEAELKLKTKQSDLKKTEHLLANAVVKSPVDGRITTLGGDSNDGQPKAYITIQQTGTYRVKGTLNEMQRGTVMEGNRIRIESRVDPTAVWTGTVTLVDYENPTQGSSNRYSSSNSDDMSSSSWYPFYVELDSSDGMLLGQHVYLSVMQESQEPLEGLTLGSAFVCFDEEGNAFVWADNGQGKLEKRPVELGRYDEAADVYEILSGLSEQDYVAVPDDSVCIEGAPTTKTKQGGAK